MDTETLKILSDISWAGVIALSIVFIVKPLIEFVLNKINGKNNNGKLNDLQKMVTNDMRHELDRIWNCIDKINERLDDFERRLVRIEVKIKNGQN